MLSTFRHVCGLITHADISKTDAASITEVDVQMFHDESWKSIYFGVTRSNVKVTSHENIAWVIAALL